jgi:hypothetical protein
VHFQPALGGAYWTGLDKHRQAAFLSLGNMRSLFPSATRVKLKG